MATEVEEEALAQRYILVGVSSKGGVLMLVSELVVGHSLQSNL